MSSIPAPWWQTAVIYQIYPRSFQDSGTDGVGDLPGILVRLDYLAQRPGGLGVDALWISPFYPSPMADFGYDVADYTGVDPLFGTLADFDALIARTHALGLKLILDFVPNHTSDQHPWFLESRSSRDNPRRGWYLWRDPAPGTGPAADRLPNNWRSHFGGPAWTFDDSTQQFYLHSFLPQQPDLNWRNPAVHDALFTAMRFWLERGPDGRGVDGFRMDVLWLLIKDDQFRDNPRNPDWQPGGSSYGEFLPLYTADRPETHTIVAEMRSLLNRYPGDRLLIGEIYLPIPDLFRYYGASAPEGQSPTPDLPQLSSEIGGPAEPLTGDNAVVLSEPRTLNPEPRLTGAQLPFNFHLIQTPWQAPALAALIHDYEAALPPGAWPNYVLGNHDQSRLATRIGAAQARVAAMLLLTLRGTPTLYYGDELGLPDTPIPAVLIQDPAELRQPGIGMGRDPERTPMLWDPSANAGFTAPAAVPWLPLTPNHHAHAVSTQKDDPASILTLYRTLLNLRRAHPALHSGAISHVASLDDAVLTYRRSFGSDGFQVLLNLTATSRTVPCPPARILFSTDPARTIGLPTPLELHPGEGILLRLR